LSNTGKYSFYLYVIDERTQRESFSKKPDQQIRGILERRRTKVHTHHDPVGLSGRGEQFVKDLKKRPGNVPRSYPKRMEARSQINVIAAQFDPSGSTSNSRASLWAVAALSEQTEEIPGFPFAKRNRGRQFCTEQTNIKLFHLFFYRDNFPAFLSSFNAFSVSMTGMISATPRSVQLNMDDAR